MQSENIENNKQCLQSKLSLKRKITDSSEKTVNLAMKTCDSDKSMKTEDSLTDFKSPKEETKCKSMLSKFKKDPKKVRKKIVPSKATSKSKTRITHFNKSQPSIESSFFKSETQNQNIVKESKLCPVCMKSFKDDTAITNHIKSCLIEKKVSLKQFIEAKKLQDRQAKERKAIGLLAAPVLVEKKKSSRKNHDTVNDPQLQLVLAMSESLYQEEQKVHLEEAALLAGISPQIIQEMNAEERRKTLQNFGFTTNKPTCPSRTKKKRLHGPTVLQTRSKEENERVLTERIASILTGDEDITQVSQKININVIKNRKSVLQRSILKEIEQLDERLWDRSNLIKKNTNFYVNELRSHFLKTTNEKNESSDFKPTKQVNDNENNDISDNLALYDPMDTNFLLNYENKRNSSIQVLSTNIPKTMNTEIDFMNKFASDWSEALNNSKNSDIVIFTKNNKQIYAHKLIFYWRCQKILRDIQPNSANSTINEKICWIENNENSVLAFLEFIYCGKIEKNSCIFYHNKLIPEVQRLAETYEMEDLITYLQIIQDKYKDEERILSKSENDMHEALTPEDIHEALTPQDVHDVLTQQDIHEALTPQLSPNDCVNLGSDDDSFYTAITPPKLIESESQNTKDLPKTDLTLFIEKVHRLNQKSPLDSFTDDSDLVIDFPVQRKNPFSKKRKDDSLDYLKKESSTSEKCKHVLSLLEQDVQKLKDNKTDANSNKSLTNKLLTDNSIINFPMDSEAIDSKTQSFINTSVKNNKQFEQTKDNDLSVSSIEDETLNDSQLSAYSKYKKYNVNNSIYKYRAELNSDFWKNLSTNDSNIKSNKIDKINKSTIFSKKVSVDKKSNDVLEDITLVSDSEDEEVTTSNLKNGNHNSIASTESKCSFQQTLDKSPKVQSPEALQNKTKRDFIEISLDSDEDDLFDDSSFICKSQNKSSFSIKNKKCKNDSNISKEQLNLLEKNHNEIEAKINKILEPNLNTSDTEESEIIKSTSCKIINDKSNYFTRNTINSSPITIDSSPEDCEFNEKSFEDSSKNINETRINNLSNRNVNISKRNKTIKLDSTKDQSCDEDSRNYTLPLDYSMLDTPELKKELKKFGVKPLEKNKAKRILKHIYDETHKTCLISESSKQSTSKNSDDCLPIAEEMEYEELDSDNVSENPVSIKDIFFRLIKINKELYTKVLTYEPLPLETLHLMMKRNGVKIKMNSLMDFLDEQCITFQMQSSKSIKSKKKQ